MNEVKVRLESYIRYKGVSVREFERNAKLSVGFVRNIRQNISPTKQKAIRSAYPELNVGWLLSATYADFQHFKNRCVILCVTVQSSHIFFYIITCASNAAEIQAIVSIVTFIFPFSIRER